MLSSSVDETQFRKTLVIRVRTGVAAIRAAVIRQTTEFRAKTDKIDAVDDKTNRAALDAHGRMNGVEDNMTAIGSSAVEHQDRVS